MTNIKFILLLSIFITFKISAQNDSINYNVELMGITSSGKYTPFWIQSNQWGKVSAEPNSTNLILGLNKEYGSKSRILDFGYKANIILQSSSYSSNAFIHELFIKVKLTVVDITIGAREEFLGNQDSTLSSGGFLFSQNARPIPKVTIGIEHFTKIPYTGGFIEIKGALSQGIFMDNIYVQNELLHHKYGYIRIGGTLPIHLQYGLDHTALWGGNIPGIGKQTISLKDYENVFFARNGGANTNISEQMNAQGDHRISQSLKLETEICDFKINTYWQNFSEDGPVNFITNAVNLPDGLWGISVRSNKKSFINAFVFEYLNTTDQSGTIFQKDGIIFGGRDNYFNNGIYESGWNNFSRTIGTPFISSPLYNTNKEISTTNNRVEVQHFGVAGEILGYRYRSLCSLSKNYGTYDLPYQKMIPNASLMLEVKKQFSNWYNTECGITVANDHGALYGNSLGCLISIRKTGSLFK
jgi:Capsule assembly protein Wzi